ncbi:MAG: DNA polymerase II [Pseudomonadales bacterium]|nr:DNA polymerase II [Pseudomonadales bacterium]MDP6471465.1 DNA polymerase II [Pseudomonadales bacterium]MDP6828634.1 DNA polymerase II [Pseudomonadales bacterium]MDP6972353.1 DNA polymerase II [Pseudomonadales bacterium]
MSTHEGFILQATYRNQGGLPVVYLFGRLTDGATFLIRDRSETPHFYIRRRDEARARELGATLIESQRTTFVGEPVFRIDVALPRDAPPLRDQFHQFGVDTFEADVRFAVRYLVDRDIKGGCRIEGTPQRGTGTNWVFDEPNLTPSTVSLDPRVLSFDIETNAEADRVLAISLYGCGVDEVLVVDPAGRDMPSGAAGYMNEKSAIEAFCRRVMEIDPDILTGWNVVDFDLSVLSRIAARVRTPFELGRVQGRLTIRPARGYFGSGSATIPGRVVLDGMDLLRGAFMRMDDFSLDAVARQVLGEGKVVAGDVTDRVGEILANYRDDLPAFCLYARTDARLVIDILEKLDLVQLSLARSRLTGMAPDRVAASIASFDFLYLAEIHKRGIVAPSVRSNDSRVGQVGGHVFEPVTGMHQNVWVFDFKSLYPSIIRTYNIDPLGYVQPGAPPGDYVEVTSGARFSRAPAILPGMLDTLFPAREAARREGDDVASQAIKILMNSFYGVLGTPACRFHNPAIANAITGQGRHLLQWSRSWFEARGYPVLYGDTDSVFVYSGERNSDVALEAGPRLAEAMTRELAEQIRSSVGVESRLELEFEKLYAKLFLAEVRSGQGGARKRYAGLRWGETDVEFVGMEVVRRDWTDLAKTVQRGLYRRLFDEQPVDEYLKGIVARVRAGEMDDQLVYRKGLRKPVEEYTASTPPHVVAARRSKNPTARVVHYLVTYNGPEPLDTLTAQPDHEHYVDKQIRPVAEPVLGALSLNFDAVIGDDRQMELF